MARHLVVRVSAEEVAAWTKRWPGAGAPDQAVTFTYESNGDLVDIEPFVEWGDSHALSILSQDAQRGKIGTVVSRSTPARVNPGFDNSPDPRDEGDAELWTTINVFRRDEKPVYHATRRDAEAYARTKKTGEAKMVPPTNEKERVIARWSSRGGKHILVLDKSPWGYHLGGSNFGSMAIMADTDADAIAQVQAKVDQGMGAPDRAKTRLARINPGANEGTGVYRATKQGMKPGYWRIVDPRGTTILSGYRGAKAAREQADYLNEHYLDKGHRPGISGQGPVKENPSGHNEDKVDAWDSKVHPGVRFVSHFWERSFGHKTQRIDVIRDNKVIGQLQTRVTFRRGRMPERSETSTAAVGGGAVRGMNVEWLLRQAGNPTTGRTVRENAGARLGIGKVVPQEWDWIRALSFFQRYRRGSEAKLANNTIVRTRETAERGSPDVEIVLHGTPIVTFHADGTLTLNSGGYQTVTTKARMNSLLPGSVGVVQKRGKWLLWDRATDTSVPFFDGMRFGIKSD